MRTISALTLLLGGLFVGCGETPSPTSSSLSNTVQPPGPLPATAHPNCLKEEVVKPTPENESAYIAQGFNQYAQIVAPNGKPIKLFAQNQVSAEKLRRAHSLMSFFLQNVPHPPSDIFGTSKKLTLSVLSLS